MPEDLGLRLDYLTLAVAESNEEIQADVDHEVCADADLEREEHPFGGGVEAHSIGGNEALVADESKADYDPINELLVVWVNNWGTTATAAWDVHHISPVR